MKPIKAFDYKANEDFENMLSQLPITLENLLLDKVRDKIKIPLFWNTYVIILTQFRVRDFS